MKTIFTVLAAIVSLTSCSSLFPDIKFSPQYPGVDPQVQYLVDEYVKLSELNRLIFDKKVTVGFKKINRGNVIGICTFGSNWREIDLDVDFWEYNSDTERLALVFHELTHCYCARAHDWAAGHSYPSTESARIKEAKIWLNDGGPRPGYLEDGCPSSLMHPVVVEEECVLTHYDYYISEMFDRCQPY